MKMLHLVKAWSNALGDKRTATNHLISVWNKAIENRSFREYGLRREIGRKFGRNEQMNENKRKRIDDLL